MLRLKALEGVKDEKEIKRINEMYLKRRTSTKGYDLLNAQIDWHKKFKKGEDGELKGMSEGSFIFHLEKCFKILKKLNPKKNIYKKVFNITLDRLKADSNFKFSKKFVKNVLVPRWDKSNIDDLSKFFSNRDWKYKGGNQVTRKEFITFLNDDKYRYKLKMRLEAFRDVLREHRYIDIETDLGISSYSVNRGYKEVIELARRWNKEVIGSKTLKSYIKREVMSEKIIDHLGISDEEIVDKVSKYLGGTKSLPPYMSYIYIVAQKVYQQFSYSQITDITGESNKSTIKAFKSFVRDRMTEKEIVEEVESLIENVSYLRINRMSVNDKSRVIGFIDVEQNNLTTIEFDGKEVSVYLKDDYNDFEDEGEKTWYKHWANSFGTPSLEM